MKPEQFKRLLDDYEMTPAECASFIGSHPTTVYRWLMDGGNVPQSVIFVFGLMRRAKIKPTGVEYAVARSLHSFLR